MRGRIEGVYLDADLHAQLERLAAITRKSKGSILRAALLNLLASNAVKTIFQEKGEEK